MSRARHANSLGSVVAARAGSRRTSSSTWGLALAAAGALHGDDVLVFREGLELAEPQGRKRALAALSKLLIRAHARSPPSLVETVDTLSSRPLHHGIAGPRIKRMRSSPAGTMRTFVGAAGVAAGWVTTTLCPATVSVVVRTEAVVLAVAAIVTVPLPVPLPPLVMVSQDSDSDAAHAQVLVVVTVTLALPPLASSEGGFAARP